MKKRNWITGLLAAAAAVWLAGCASGPATQTAMLTYETAPEGATLYEGGQSIGTAPVTRTYAGDGKSDSIRTPEVTAVWPSGAKEVFFTVIPVGSDRAATIERPARAPNLALDQENAKKYISAKELEARRKKEETARELARASERCKAQQARGAKAGVDDCS